MIVKKRFVSVPKSLHLDIERFFDLFSDLARGNSEEYSYEKNGTYEMVSEVTKRGLCLDKHVDQKKINQTLLEFIEFFERIPKGGGMDEKSLMIACRLVLFLTQLQSDGNSEAYTERVKDIE
jgi:hypothetical protein